MGAKRTVTERKFIEAYIENNGNGTKAYQATHPDYKGKNAKDMGSRMLAKVNIETTELLNEMGITDAFLAGILKKGLTSTKAVGLIPITIDDYAVIYKYLDMAYKLTGTYPAEKHEETRKVIVLGKKEKEEDEIKD